jgi:hypothetical protein
MMMHCRKCGSIKIAPPGHNPIRAIAKLFGRRLAACAECGRWRVMERGERIGRYRTKSKLPREEILETYGAHGAAIEVIRPPQEGSSPAGCPRCGSHKFRRSRRSFWEKLAGSPPMMRCRKCRHRF